MAEKREEEKEKESGTKEKKFNDKLPTPETVSRIVGRSRNNHYRPTNERGT